MKRRTWWSTTVGAIPGAMPPMIGYAAAAGVLTRESWVLFAILFLWQFPHFYSIAWMYKEDYARAGIQMLPVVDPDCRSTARQIVLYGIALIPVSLVPGMLGMTGRIYLIGALVLGLVYLYSGVRVALERSLVRARAVLLTSVLYLPLIYGLMLLDRVEKPRGVRTLACSVESQLDASAPWAGNSACATGASQFFMKFRGPNAHPNRPGL
jgi:protoheme IX farnesyltransferase